VSHRGTYPEFELLVVSDGDIVALATVRTPPFNLILSDATDETALDVLLDALGGDQPNIPGVVGNLPTVDAFVDRWRRRTGGNAEARMRQGVFELRAVENVPPVEGEVFRAGPQDREIVARWFRAFELEAHPGADASGDEDDPSVTERSLDLRLSGAEDAGLWLLRVGSEPVSLAGFGGPTPSGIRIGPVYTPPEHRRHGDATWLVAALSERLLAGGRRFCFLYTDLSNPTSNAIYERIGYARVCDSKELAFV